MKNLNRYIFLAILSLAASGCMNEEDIIPSDESKAVEMTFTATMEDGEQTKTTLGESDEYGHRDLLWFPEDSIGIADNDYGRISKFVNIKTETGDEGIFEGTLERSYENYYAVYPYNENFTYNWNSFRLSIPSTQKYEKGTFASDMNVMVAKAQKGEDLVFRNLCGILILHLTGEQIVKSISFSAKDETGNPAKLSGEFDVMLDYVEAPVLTPTTLSNTIVSLDCGEGVQLSVADPTPFYLVLPPGTYSDLLVTVGTNDGEIMLKKGSKPLIISRAQYVTAGILPYASEIAIDLSTKGTANCYITSEAGVYSFDASTIGNGEFGLTNAASSLSYHTTDASISPVSAELLWSDGRGSVGGVSFDKKNNRINFVATGNEGNAVIAAKDAEGNIIWSWHIWSTDKPQDHLYKNSYGNFTVLDRNLGATRADAGADDVENRESIGTVYQWGRKDPFYAKKSENEDWERFYDYRNTRFTTAESIQMPQSFSSGNSEWNRDGMTNLWSTTSKTVYDPCPAGYRVAGKEIFKGFTTTGENVDRLADINYSGEFEKGFYLKYDGSNTAWYPVTYRIEIWGNHYYPDTESHTWTSEQSQAFYYQYSDDMVCTMHVGNNWMECVNALTVRCMKDDATASLIVKINDIEDVGATRAAVTGKIATYGDMTVTSSGFVFGNSSTLDLNNGTVYNSDKLTGQISAEITGLTPLTRYYVRAYATTAEGTTYSDVKSFLTPNNEGIIDLSVAGSANSYIVKPVYSTYTFDMVKGNSDESVGDAATAEILWETYNTSDAVTQNSVIGSVKIDGDKVKFTMPEESVPGNAVIAVKDEEGVILWSWHIWVVDFDPETTKQTYISGAVMMDRNLGALAINDYDSRTHGLYYQWGRKDPFAPPVSNYNIAQTYPTDILSYAEKISDYDYSIQNPTVSLTDGDWNSANDLWNTNKTIYDPCPAGWRVPDGGPGAWRNIDYWNYGSWGSWGILTKVNAPYSNPTAYYSSGGYMDSYNNIKEYESASYCYSCTISTEGSDVHYPHTIRICDGFSTTYSMSKESKLPVRCMKETTPEGGNEGYGESDDYEW